MILAATEVLTSIGLTATAIGTFVGSWALFQAKKTESKAATREEVNQAFEMQGTMLNRYKEDNDRLRGRNDQMHDTINRLVAQVAETKVKHEKCEKDTNAIADRLRIAENHLRVAEARISELGG